MAPSLVELCVDRLAALPGVRANVPLPVQQQLDQAHHRRRLRAVLYALVHNTVWIRHGGRTTFMVCNAPSYYAMLDPP